MTVKQKLAHYITPDYCLETRIVTLNILLTSLTSLFEQEGVFYALYHDTNEYKVQDFITHQHAGEDLVRVVIFFDDP